MSGVRLSPAGRVVAAAIAERRVSVFDLDICAFCEEMGPDRHKCVWRVDKEVDIAASDLRAGDLMRIGTNDFRHVAHVYRSHDGKSVFYVLVGRSDAGVLRSDASFEAKVRGIRLAPCAAICCDLCSCERADGVHYCADHWRLPSNERSLTYGVAD